MITRFPPLICVAILSMAPLARGTLPQSLCSIAAEAMFAAAPDVPGRQAHDTPFLYKGPGGWRQPFAPAALGEWAAAVQHHQPGDVDESLRTIAAWPHPRVAGALADVDAIWASLRKRRGERDPMASPISIRGYEARLSDALALLHMPANAMVPFDVSGLLRRAAVLHTDIAIAQWATSAGADIWTESSAASFHLGVANVIVERLSLDGPEPFVVLWYRATAALLHSRHEVLVQPAFLESTLAITGDDLGVLLMAGALRELLASPQMQLAPLSTRRGSRDAHLREAGRFYRRALDVDGRSTEARVRLAHVLVQMERPEAASEMLSGVRIEGRSPIDYFVHLVRGEADEALGRFDAAGRSYLKALEMYPHATSGALAVSHLARRQGDRAAAAVPVVQMLELARSPADDPWTGYFIAGDGRRADALIAAMREASQERR